MRIVVIGGTGLIGSRAVEIERRRGHQVVAAAPNTGVNTITGEGLREAMADAQLVIDLANSPSFEDAAALEFFEISGRNILAAEAAAGVRHHIALSIVGVDRNTEIGYFQAKLAQEKLIESCTVPYTIIRSTQFLNSSGESPTQVGMETSSEFRRPCSSPSQRTTLPPSLPTWRSRRRETESSRSRVRNERRSMNSSPVI